MNPRSSLLRQYLIAFALLLVGAMLNEISYDVSQILRKPSIDGMESAKDEANTSNNDDCLHPPCDLSLVFLGDSLTRFQYYSLVYFLRHSRWIDPESNPHLVRPMDYIGGFELNFDWNPWFRASMEALAPYENCDCHREAGRLNGRQGKLPYACENRYYYDPLRNNRVTFLQAFGSATSIRGHWNATEAIPQLQAFHANNDTAAIGVTVGPLQERLPYVWEDGWADAIRGHIADLNPAALILNAGKWQHSFLEPDFRQEVIQALNESSIPRVLWKTNTADRGGKLNTDPTDSTMCQLLECMNVSWTQSVPTNLYVDQGHFLEPIYRLLNEQLLHQLSIALTHRPYGVFPTNSTTFYPSLPIPGLQSI